MEKGQVRSLITEFTRCALNLSTNAELKFNFTMNNKVFSVYITDEVQQQLLRGVLGIVRHDEKTYIVPFKLAERVSLLVPDWCGYLATEKDLEVTPEDDPYADYANSGRSYVVEILMESVRVAITFDLLHSLF